MDYDLIYRKFIQEQWRTVLANVVTTCLKMLIILLPLNLMDGCSEKEFDGPKHQA